MALPPAVACRSAWVAHELATNAAKYGALSVPEGRSRCAGASRTGGSPCGGSETGGPPVAPPARAGFGTRLIRASIERELAGRAALDYAPGGFVCAISVPLAPRVAPADVVAEAQDAA